MNPAFQLEDTKKITNGSYEYTQRNFDNIMKIVKIKLSIIQKTRKEMLVSLFKKKSTRH